MGPSALPALSLRQLQQIAFRCGLPKSGTKPVLEQLILAHRDGWKPFGAEARILSIDLGIRNLGISLLTPSPGGSTNLVSALPESRRSLPTVHTWKRLELQNYREKSSTRSEVDGVLSEIEEDQGSPPLDLRTPSLAAATLKLVQEQFLPLEPTHVLLEAQRFRSGSGAAVQQWTIYVNTLEAMLYAVFSTLRACGRWDGVLCPMDPKRVTSFILDDGKDSSVVTARAMHGSRSKVKQQKAAKIALVGYWLSQGQGVRPVDQAENMSSLFIERLAAQSSGSRERTASGDTVAGTHKPEKLTKLDDLADSLIQGVTWFRWQANSAAAQKDVTNLITKDNAKDDP
jgi:cruciform cutting endonuclease 1